MAALGSLVVKLGLDFAQYTGGLDKSEQASLAAAKRIQDTFDGMKSKMAAAAGAIAGGLAAGFTINAFKGLLTGAIETGAALDDLRMQTGSTVEALSGLVAIGKFNNMGAEQIGGAMNKLAANLAGASEESKGAGKALEALGIDFSTFKNLRPEDQMQTVAKAMANFEDGTGKAAVAMALYGKQGAAMLPFLSDLAEAETLTAKTTTAQAAAAASLDDNLTRLATSGDAWKKELAQGMIPALDLGAKALVGVINGSGGLREEVRRLVADGSIDRWTKAAVNGLTYAADAAQYLWRGVKVLGESMGAWAAAGATYFGGMAEAIKKVITGDYSGAIDSIRSGVSGAKNIMADLGATTIETFSEDTVGARIRARMGEIEATGNTAEKTGKKLDFTNVLGKTAKAAKEAKNPLDALLDSIDKRIAVGREELSMGTKLTDGEKLAAEINLKVKNSKDAQILAGKGQIEIKLQEMLTTERAVATHRQELKILEDLRQARVKESDGIEAWMRAQEEAAAQTQKSISDRISGLASEEEAVKLARTLNISLAEAIERVAIARLREKRDGPTGAYVGSPAYQELTEEIALREKLARGINSKDVREASDRTREDWKREFDEVGRGLGDAVEIAITKGSKAGGQKMREVLENALRKPFRMMIDGVMNQLTGGLMNMVGLGGGGAQGGGGGGGLGNLASLGSSAYQFSQGGGMLYNAYGAASAYLGVGNTAAATYLSHPLAGIAANGTVPALATPSAGATLGGTGTAGGMGAMATGGIVLAIMLGVINMLGGMRSETMIGSGLAGTLGGDKALTPWQEWREGGTLIDGSSFATHNPLEELSSKRAELQAVRDRGDGATNYAIGLQAIVTDLEKTTKGLATQTEVFDREISKGYKAYRSNVVNMANSLGLAGDSVKDFAYTLGAQDLNLQGLNPEEIQAKITATFGKAGDSMAKIFLGSMKEVTDTIVDTWVDTTDPQNPIYTTNTTVNKRMEYEPSEFAKAGETAIDTLTRLSTSFTAVNDASEMMGMGLHTASLSAAAFASDIVDAFGGLERFAATTGAFFQNFYSGEARRQQLANQGSRALGAMGWNITPEQLLGLNRNDIAEFFEGAIAGGTEGFDTIARGMEIFNGLSGMWEPIAEGVPAVQNLSDAVDEMTQRFNSAKDSLLDDAKSLAVERLRAEGDEAGARALEKANYLSQFAGLDETRRKEIETLYDANRATRDYIDGLEKAAQAERNRLADLRTSLVDMVDAAALKTDQAMAAFERAAAKERESLTAIVTEVRGVFDAASNGAKALFGEVEAVAKFQGRMGQDFIAQALAKATAGGGLPSSKELAEAIAGANAGLGKEVFASQAEADYARLVLANELKGLADISGDQLTEAEAQLKKLDDQIKIGREQIDLLRGVNVGLGTLDETLQGVIAAFNAESQTRSNVKAQAIIGSGSAIYDKASGAGLSKTGTYFERDELILAAQETLAANPNAAGALSVYESLAAGGFTLAQYNDMFGMPAGTLEAEAKALGRPIFHKGTNYVPRTGFALLQEGEAVIPAAQNPFSGSLRGLGGDTVRLENLVAGLTAEVQRLQGVVAAGNASAALTAGVLTAVKNGSGLNMAPAPVF